MTFLLFLISLAALERVLRPRERICGETPQPNPEPAAESGLYTLGHTLDQFGRGPGVSAQPAISHQEAETS